MTMKNYRSFDSETLNIQYNVVASIADLPQLFQSFRTHSAEFRQGKESGLDQPYGPSLAEVCDVFPANKPGAPIHIFLHGGYWYQFGKDEFSFMAEGLLAGGATVIIANYALCPQVSMSEIVRQMEALVVWCWHNATRIGGDRERIYVSGHSAGGHLVACLAGTPWENRYGCPSNIIKGATAISGIFDLRPIQQSYVQEYVCLCDSEVEALSPLFHIKADCAPLILAVGGLESDEFKRQTLEYGIGYREAGNSITNIELTAHDHLSLLQEFSRSDGDLCRVISDQMGI